MTLRIANVQLFGHLLLVVSGGYLKKNEVGRVCSTYGG
jgi:hypothetical protein